MVLHTVDFLFRGFCFQLTVHFVTDDFIYKKMNVTRSLALRWEGNVECPNYIYTSSLTSLQEYKTTLKLIQESRFLPSMMSVFILLISLLNSLRISCFTCSKSADKTVSPFTFGNDSSLDANCRLDGFGEASQPLLASLLAAFPLPLLPNPFLSAVL